MSYSGSDPWGYNSFDGSAFSSAADAASWTSQAGNYSAGASGLTSMAQTGGNYFDSLMRLADTSLRVNGAVNLQKAQNGSVQYQEGAPGVYASQASAPVGFSISPGLLVLAGIGVFAFMASKG